MRIDPIKNKYFEYLRDILKEKWDHNHYIGSKLTAAGLKELLKKTLNKGCDEKKQIVIRFLGINNPSFVSELELMNKSKCIENFYLGRSSCTNENTKQFIVDFFDVNIKSIDEYKAVFVNNNSLISPDKFISKHLTKWLNNKHYFVKPEIYDEIMENYKLSDKTNQLSAYILACSLHYGNKAIRFLASENHDNELAVETSLVMLIGYGIRVGWRAEYALSLMNYKLFVENYFLKNPQKEKIIKESLTRLENGLTKEYLESIVKITNDHKLKEYAKQVLAIII